MECGVPFCHHGCPLGNLIPDWNDLVYRDRFREAIDQLHRTNNFPEFTGRLCPAPCEAACVLEIEEGNAVTIKQIELAIVDRAWEESWIVAEPPRDAHRPHRRRRRIGTGRSGVRAAAEPIGAHGDRVRARRSRRRPVRFGIPDFKIEKHVVERRLAQLAEEGVEFRFGVDVGIDVDAAELRESFDAVVLAVGSRVPRDLPVPGRELRGVHFAMEYLYGRNRDIGGTAKPDITAHGKHVIVVGGGDTGADCVASAHREGAASVTQIELLGEPPARRSDELTPWPLWPVKLRTSYALKEGGERSFADLDHPSLRQRPGRAHPLAAEQRHAALRAGARHRRVASRRSRAACDGIRRSRSRSCRTRSASNGMRAATSRPPPMRPACPVSSPQATRAAGSRSSCGRSKRAAAAPRRSTPGSARTGTPSSRSQLAHADEARAARRLPLDAGDDHLRVRALAPALFVLADRRRVAACGRDNPVRHDRAQRLRLVEQRRQSGRAASATTGEARKTGSPPVGSAAPEAVTRWPPPRVVERLQSWAHEHGRPPTLEEWRRAGTRHPSAATVRRLFGSWNAALVAAGFEMRPPGVPVEPRSVTHARCEKTGRWTARPA